ncbi:MAG: NADH:flavin oxidoreductase [Cyanobacteria bacterium SZAS LIN-3]|nr:NADH:flavin oxidoreductase [Cyanobacteria bacterium SZAS LIN-3]
MTTKLASKLFQPFKLHNLNLPNRVVMAPMTRSKSPNGIPRDNVADYYGRRAKGGVGLIITEGTFVDDNGSGSHWQPNVPRFYGQDALTGWRRVVERVHAEGGLIFPQLWHLGITPSPGAAPDAENAVGPSGIATDGSKLNEPMTLARIEQSIAAYGRSAAAARAAGFDGLELHGAHGYFLDQFIWSRTNQRTDKYGGKTLGERARFVAEVVAEVRRQVGPDFPISLRISQWKLGDYDFKNATTPDELNDWITPLAEAGVDIFHCSSRRFWEPEFEGSSLNLAGWVKKLSGKPTITVGSVSLNEDFITTFGRLPSSDKYGDPKAITFHDLEERLERNEFDLVAVGRALITNPNWANLVKDNQTSELKPYNKEDLNELN